MGGRARRRRSRRLGHQLLADVAGHERASLGDGLGREPDVGEEVERSATASGASTTRYAPGSRSSGRSEREARSAARAPSASAARLEASASTNEAQPLPPFVAHREHGGRRARRAACADATPCEFATATTSLGDLAPCRPPSGPRCADCPMMRCSRWARASASKARVASARRRGRAGLRSAGGQARERGVLGRVTRAASTARSAARAQRLGIEAVGGGHAHARAEDRAHGDAACRSSVTFWWMRLPAKRVSAEVPRRRAPRPGRRGVSTTMRRASLERLLGGHGRSASHPHLHVAEAGGRGAVRDVGDLHRLALAAVGQAPDLPVVAASTPRRTTPRTRA